MKGKLANPRVILFIGAFCVSMSSLLIRSSNAPALVSATFRQIWTVLLLTPFVLRNNWAEWKALARKDLLFCILSGLLLALHFATWFQAAKTTSVANATVLVCTEVIFSALGYAFILRGRIPKLGIIAMGITFVGAAMIALASQQSGSNWRGDVLALVAAILVAAYTLVGRRQRRYMSTSLYTYLTYVSCTFFLLLLDLATGTTLKGWGARELGIGLLLCIFCTLLGHNIFSWCLKYLDPVFVSASKLTEPIYATAIATVLFQEIPRLQQIFGGVLVIGGILLYTYTEGSATTKQLGIKEQATGKEIERIV